MKEFNKPVSFVQHEYRYLHDVEASHGRLAAILEGLGIAAGAALGVAATGSIYGGALGAEAAQAAEGQIFYKTIGSAPPTATPTPIRIPTSPSLSAAISPMWSVSSATRFPTD